jgi:hypothetical protein
MIRGAIALRAHSASIRAGLACEWSGGKELDESKPCLVA